MMNIFGSIDKDTKELANSLYSFAKSYMKFDKDVTRTNFVSDQENAKKKLGMTGYYSPTDFSVTLYVDNRHPKDVLRSMAHELVHHAQNCRGEFNDGSLDAAAEDGYAQKNGKLRKMEREAFLRGNMCFRDWEDGIKYSKKNKKAPSYVTENVMRSMRLLNEGYERQKLLEKALRNKWSYAPELQDWSNTSVDGDLEEREAVSANYKHVDDLAKRFQQTQEEAELEVLKQAFEQHIVPELAALNLDYKGFHKYDALLERETVAVFRALSVDNDSEVDYKVARIHIDLDPLSGLFGTSIETEYDETQKFWRNIGMALSHVRSVLGKKEQIQEAIKEADSPKGKTIKLSDKEIARADDTTRGFKITVAARKQQDGSYVYFLVNADTGTIMDYGDQAKEPLRWFQKLGGWSDMADAARHRQGIKQTKQSSEIKENMGMKNVPKPGKFKYTKKVTTENIRNIVEGYIKKLKENKGTLGQRQIQEMVNKVVRFMTEQDDKNMTKAANKPAGALIEQDDKNMSKAANKPAGALIEQDDKNMSKAANKPKGAMIEEGGANEYKLEKAGNKPKNSLVESELDKLVNEVMSEYDSELDEPTMASDSFDRDPSMPWTSPEHEISGDELAMHDDSMQNPWQGDPRATDEISSYRSELGAPSSTDVIEDVGSTTDELTAETEPNWLYDDTDIEYEENLYEGCTNGTRDKLHESRQSRVAKKLLSWATR